MANELSLLGEELSYLEAGYIYIVIAIFLKQAFYRSTLFSGEWPIHSPVSHHYRSNVRSRLFLLKRLFD